MSDPAPTVRKWLLSGLRAGRDLVLLVGDYAPRAVPPARKAARRIQAAAAVSAAWTRDRAGQKLAPAEKVTAQAETAAPEAGKVTPKGGAVSPQARKLAKRSLVTLRDLALLAGDYAVRAVPPARALARRLAQRAAPPARGAARQLRRNLVFPARNLMILGALVLLCVGVAQTGPGHTVLADAGLYQRPVSYTELTFTSPGTLPSSLARARSSIDLSFGIHNVSGAARSYQWSVVLAGDGEGRVAAAGTAAVPDQGRVTVTRAVAAACSGTRLQVQVRLASPAESIHFWVTCPAAAGGAQ